ncbi:SDR family NAD(P)-dependent oxidoreductase [Chloroflexota bacterium]
MKEYRVDGKVAIVTGSGRGIGKAIALALAEAGADIVLAARTKKQIEQTAEELRKMGSKAIAISTDVSKEDQIRTVVEQTISEFGIIDILVNNAGISPFKPVVSTEVKLPGWEAAGDDWDNPYSLEDWHRIIDTNLTSAFLFARAVAPHMIRQKKGKIVNMSSTAGEQGIPYLSAYCVSKAGLTELTRCLASEWATFNINVNAITPGDIATDIVEGMLQDPGMRRTVLEAIPFGRLGEPREVALLTLFLVSEASSYVTGQTFTIDGGAFGRGPAI